LSCENYLQGIILPKPIHPHRDHNKPATASPARSVARKPLAYHGVSPVVPPKKIAAPAKARTGLRGAFFATALAACAVGYALSPSHPVQPQPETATKIVDACPMTNVNAIENAPDVTMKVGESLVEDYKASAALFVITADKMGIALPSHLRRGDEFLGSTAEIESMQGLDINTPGNSYIGPFGISPSKLKNSSHFADNKDKIAAMLNVARKAGNGKELDIFTQCKTDIKPETITDGNYFHDFKLQGFIVLALGYYADQSLSDFPGYKAASDQQKIAISYLNHNTSAITRFMVDNIDYKGSFAGLIKQERPKSADRWLSLMAGNPKAWSGIGRPATPEKVEFKKIRGKLVKKVTPAFDPDKITIQTVLKNIMKHTLAGAKLVQNYNPRRVAANKTGIAGYLNREDAFNRAAERYKAKTASTLTTPNR
jgi:hypothetical protein